MKTLSKVCIIKSFHLPAESCSLVGRCHNADSIYPNLSLEMGGADFLETS